MYAPTRIIWIKRDVSNSLAHQHPSEFRQQDFQVLVVIIVTKAIILSCTENLADCLVG